MSRIILVSNRLSVSVAWDGDSFVFKPSVGGLATGLSSFYQRQDSLWVGWCGLPHDQLSDDEESEVEERLRTEYKSVPVPLSTEDLNQFYYGFCNNIIWPLFHYFPTYVQYDPELWEAYRRINERYLEYLRSVAQPDDYIWIHDYQLLLLPGMVRRHLPDTKIGFFLHIPFPSYELFRLLPWRDQILEGMLGADLVGFHTYDYARHFLSSVRRLLGLENSLGVVRTRRRFTKVDVFPMGIDYEKYSQARDLPEVQEQMKTVDNSLAGHRMVFSVDRLDYSKGIPNRLEAFFRFLKRYPEYHGKIVLVMIVAPSRTEVAHYMELKRELDELVSRINGSLGTIEWTPVRYFFRAFPFEHLTALYNRADALLVTPLRDGMNLIAKEYVASRRDYRGAVVLSETAGAARELSEAFIVNPTDIERIAEALHHALSMDPEVQVKNNKLMHARLAKYNVRYWAHDFMDKLEAVIGERRNLRSRTLSTESREQLLREFRQARQRLVFLNYDGTLVEMRDRYEQIRPDQLVHSALSRLAADEHTQVVIVTGRDRKDMDALFPDRTVGIIADHGVWVRSTDGTWRMLEQLDTSWKDVVRPVLELYTARTPGSHLEEWEFSLGWVYRQADPELARVRLAELRDAISGLSSTLTLEVHDGRRVLEVKNSNVTKGRAAQDWLSTEEHDFVLAIGDDATDEELFSALPDHAYSIRVGLDISRARYILETEGQVGELVGNLAAKLDS